MVSSPDFPLMNCVIDPHTYRKAIGVQRSPLACLGRLEFVDKGFASLTIPMTLDSALIPLMMTPVWC